MSHPQDFLKLNENEKFQLNCTTTHFGYPAPKLSININKEIYIASNNRIKDSVGGELLSASVEAVAFRQWHDKAVTCNLEQPHFSAQSKSITLKINRK